LVSHKVTADERALILERREQLSRSPEPSRSSRPATPRTPPRAPPRTSPRPVSPVESVIVDEVVDWNR
jgi:hypothetical protein